MNKITKIIIAMIAMVTIGTAYTLSEPSIFDFIHVISNRQVDIGLGSQSIGAEGYGHINISASNLTPEIKMIVGNSTGIDSTTLSIRQDNISMTVRNLPGIQMPICVRTPQNTNLTICSNGKTGNYSIRMSDGTAKWFEYKYGLLIKVTNG